MKASEISPSADPQAASARAGDSVPIAGDSLPRLLLISDAPLARNSVGIDRTLFSLFEHYPEDRFLLYTRGRDARKADSEGRYVQHAVPFPNRFLRPLLTRFDHVAGVAALRRAITYADFSIRAHVAPAGLPRLNEFDPELVVVCPNSPTDLLQGYMAAKRLRRPTVMYLMDDWPAAQPQRWLGGDIDMITKCMLRDADAWIMISEALATEMSTRYQVSRKPTLIAHNAVTLDPGAPPDFRVHGGTFRIVYAGSIWPMHWDAIAAVAEACALLRQEGVDVEFVIHCPERFWSDRGAWLGARGVKNGGFVAYEGLAAALAKADLALVASSFLPQYAPYTRSSVQTKITDYMATGRPILSVGPAGCACHDFIERWRCGLMSISDDPQDMARDLRRIIADREANAMVGRRAYDVVRSEFERTTMTNRLFRFLRNVADRGESRPAGDAVRHR